MEDKHLFSNVDLKRLLLPLIVEQLLSSFMGTVDTIMVSNVGPTAMSAVSLVDSINILVIQAFGALATGGVIICAQYMGKKNEKMANRSAQQVVLTVGVISAAITVFCLLFRSGLLRGVFGSVEEAVMKDSQTYFLITALSFPFIALYNAGAAIFRAQGISKKPMVISVVSNFINIAGNAFFIWGLHLGVAGVAAATLISRIFCAAVVFYYLRKARQPIVLKDYLRFRPDWQIIKKVLAIGVPSGIENSMFQFGKLVIQSTVSTMGTAAIAAQAMTNIMESLNGVAAQGVGIGLMTVVGQCIGAGRKDEAAYYVKKLTGLSEIIMAASCGLVFLLAKPITLLAGMERESAALCLTMVTAITIVKPLVWTLSFISAYGMRAAGDVKFSMLVSTASMWICRVSLCIFLAKVFHMGPMAVWIGMFADWTVRGIIFSVRYHGRKWVDCRVTD